MHKTLQDMLKWQGGGFNWLAAHNSCFEMSKFALLDCLLNKSRPCLPLDIHGTVIKPTHSHRFLGAIVDNELHWKDHINYAVGKGTAYSLQLRRLSHTTKGIPLSLMQKLYSTVALLKMLYAINIWYQPLYQHNGDKLTRGSIQMTKKLGTVQCTALISMMGAMKITAMDTLDVTHSIPKTS